MSRLAFGARVPGRGHWRQRRRKARLDERRRNHYVPASMECSVSTKSRGRPREFDPDAALASALRVFWKHGYEGASMAELTEAMGIAKPSLYACFGNKEALFKKALDLYEREKLCYIKSSLDAPTAREIADRILRGAVKTHCGDSDPQGCMGVISSIACTTEAESIRQEVLARRASSEAAVVDRFEQAKADGDLPENVNAKALAQCLFTILQGLSVKAQVGARREELDAIVDTFLAMWPAAEPRA